MKQMLCDMSMCYRMLRPTEVSAVTYDFSQDHGIGGRLNFIIKLRSLLQKIALPISSDNLLSHLGF